MALSGSSPPEKSGNFLDREIRMVLIGKTGVGKSATGNTIRGHKVFEEDIFGNSVAKECAQNSFEQDGYEMQLVDVPGFSDPNSSYEVIRKEMARCVAMSSPGIHAILFILSIGRFTAEDEKTIDDFIDFWGEECRKYVLVIFTGKDKLDKLKKTIDEFVRCSPKSLQLFLQTVQGRYMAVNNEDKPSDKKTFTKGLVKQVLQMVQANGGMCYTNSMYRKAEIQLKQAEDEEVRKIAAKNKAMDEKLIKTETARIEAEFRKHLLSEQEHAGKKKEEEKAFKDSFEDDRRKLSRRRLRLNVGPIVGSLLAIPAGALGSVVAGPVGSVAGAAVGVAAGSALGSYIGGMIGENESD